MTIRSKNIPAVCHYYQVEIDSLQKIEIIETEKGYSQKTATGLGINDRAQSLERAYGIPCCKIKLPTLQFYRYNAYRDIVFRLKEGNIVGWYLYKK